MAVQQGALWCRRERDVEFSGGRLAGEELLQQHDPAGGLSCGLAFEQRRDFIAKAEDATRLKPDNRHAPGKVRCERRKRALGLAARFVGFTDGEKRAAAPLEDLAAGYRKVAA